MDRRTIRAWCLYDFANSSFAVLFPFVYGTYYAGSVVGGSSGDVWWGSVGSVSMLCVALSAPLLGGIADHAGVRKRMLGLYTALGVVAVLGFMGVGPGLVVTGFLFGVLANFAFEGGIVFYNAYLPEIAPPSHHGRISARGFAVGYVGSLAAIGLAALLAPRDLNWVWVAVAVQWALFAVPTFLHLPRDRPTGVSIPTAAKRGVEQTFATLRSVLGMVNLRRFLLAYFFYMDGVNTVILFSGRYASRTLHFSSMELLGMLAVVQLTALAGSVLMGKPTDVKGPRWAVRRLILWWIVVVLAASLARSKEVFWIVAVLAGLGIGGIQASSRAFMSQLIPEGREAEFFGFYALCGKTGAVVGPTLFGLVSLAFDSQRPAVLTVAAFFVAGYLLLNRVQIPARDR